MSFHTEGRDILTCYLPDPIFNNPEDAYDPEKIEEAVRRGVKRIRALMSKIWPHLSSDYKKRISIIAEEEGVEDMMQVATEYLVQEQVFGELGGAFGFESTTDFPPGDRRGVLALSLNNSILMRSPLPERRRALRKIIEFLRQKLSKVDQPDPQQQTSFRSLLVELLRFSPYSRYIRMPSRRDSWTKKKQPNEFRGGIEREGIRVGRGGPLGSGRTSEIRAIMVSPFDMEGQKFTKIATAVGDSMISVVAQRVETPPKD